MKVKELREMDLETLKSELENKRKEFLNLRFRILTNQESDVSKRRKVKKDIARILTVIKEKIRGRANE